MPTGDVANVHEVQPGGGHEALDSAGRDAGDHAAGGRRLAVALSDRRRGVDDDRARGACQPLRCKLRSLVRHRQLPGGRLVLLGRGAAGHRPAGPRGAGEEEPPHLFSLRSLEEIAGSLDIDALDLGWRGVVAVERGHVDDRLAAVDRALERARIEQVDPLVTDVRALLAELAGDVAPDEARRPAHIDLHASAALRRPSAITGQYVR